MDIVEQLRVNIAKKMKSSGITQKKLELLSGVKQTQISLFLNKRSDLSTKSIGRMLSALGLNFEINDGYNSTDEILHQIEWIRTGVDQQLRNIRDRIAAEQHVQKQIPKITIRNRRDSSRFLRDEA
jgi:transcriptional regulator with XRE-family HTH domain